MSDEPQYRDEAWMREQYVEKDKFLADIASECDCSLSTVSRWLKNHGIEVRPRGGGKEIQRQRKVPDERLTDSEWLHEQYVERKRGTPDIADECGCHHCTVQEWLDRHDIETRDSNLPEYERLDDEEWLREQYISRGLSGYDIADEVGCAFRTVYSSLRRKGIETGYNLGDEHGNWSGGKARYGPGWNEEKRSAVRERDDRTCQDPRCSVTQSQHLEEYDQKLHVHHLRKARDVDDPSERNAPDNLITLCLDCHKQWERIAVTGLVPEVVADD